MTDLAPKWIIPTGDLKITPSEVHVWRSDCRPDFSSNIDLKKFLSAEESQRAARFHFERDRLCYVASRAALRLLIFHYTGLPPDFQVFDREPKGKPFLANSPLKDRLEFNLAHSHELIVLAFSLNSRVGIDLEFQRTMPRARQIAGRFFSDREKKELDRVPTPHLEEAFFNCWTRKEALAKATGRGLAGFMDKFSVSLAPGQTARLLEIESGLVDNRQWFMESFAPAPGYKAALVLEGGPLNLSFRQFGQSLISL